MNQTSVVYFEVASIRGWLKKIDYVHTQILKVRDEKISEIEKEVKKIKINIE